MGVGGTSQNLVLHANAKQRQVLVKNDPHALRHAAHVLPCCVVVLGQQGGLEEGFRTTLVCLARAANIYGALHMPQLRAEYISLQNSDVETLTPSMMVFRDGALGR